MVPRGVGGPARPPAPRGQHPRARLARPAGDGRRARASPERTCGALVPALEPAQPLDLVRPLDRSQGAARRVTPRILAVVGTRPNFVKAAPVLRALQAQGDFDVRLLHTGQHYDHALSGAFLEQLGMPVPDFHLGGGSWTNAE